jgi:hypothetical protein
MKMVKKLENWRQSQLAPPLALLGLCLACYGIYIGWMGFYWDDWPIIWFADVGGPQALLWFEFQRPLAGPWFAALFTLLGDMPLVWQASMVGLRWLTGVAAWWLLVSIWPKRKGQALAAAMLFTVFPGFGQQFVSVTGSRHLFGLALSLGSMAVMVRAEKGAKRTWLLRGVSIAVALAGMLCTEYFYGLELLRPFVLWAAAEEDERRIGGILRHWLPYAVPALGVFLWRQSITQFGNYELAVAENLSAKPLSTVWQLMGTMLNDLWTATWGVWSRALHPPMLRLLSGRAVWYYWGLVVGGASAIFIFTYSDKHWKSIRLWGLGAMALGVIALLSGGSSFWLIGLNLKLTFPGDRLMLPMMLGSALVVCGAIEFAFTSRGFRALALAVFIGFAVGASFLNALDYRNDWNAEKEFLQQLAWRIPGLKAGTTLVSEELPLNYATDNALTAVVNALYAPGFEAASNYYDYEYRVEDFTGLPVAMRYLDLRLGWQLPYPADAADYEAPYRYFKIRGNSADVLLLYYQPPYCLRVLDPVYDEGHPLLLGADFYFEHPELREAEFGREFPALPELTAEMLPYSNTDLILTDAPVGQLPVRWFGEQDEGESWCAYFEQAELARQRGEWKTVVGLGDEALARFGEPQHASELAVFIEGYGRVGNWAAAEDLTQQALELDGAMQTMLCQTWGRLEGERSAAMRTELDCGTD